MREQLNSYINSFFVEQNDLMRNKIPMKHFEILKKYYFKHILKNKEDQLAREQEKQTFVQYQQQPQHQILTNSLVNQQIAQTERGQAPPEDGNPDAQHSSPYLKQPALAFGGKNPKKQNHRSVSVYDRNTLPTEEEEIEWKMPTLIKRSSNYKEHLIRVYNREGTPIIKYNLPCSFQGKLRQLKQLKNQNVNSLTQTGAWSDPPHRFILHQPPKRREMKF